ncbi:MAG: restriction endonuclease subunit S [Mesonia hippocampi]|uniref:restriction endonuclease subunit S n=1 Tax=Mesonia hippocampi TaxID=1628250 RepID=UPI003F9D0573
MENNKMPELRFPEFNNQWLEKRYDDIYSFKTTNSLSRDKLNYENGVVKNIHYGDIHTKFDSLFDITKERVPFINIDEDISKIQDECYLEVGDLVIADASEDYNDIGKTLEIQNLNNEKVLAGLHTLLARKESEDMALNFASFLMKTRSVRLQIMRIAQGTKVLGLSKNRLDKIPLIIPSPEEQNKIASFLIAIDKRIQLLEKKKTDLEQYKKCVMQKIFSQEIRFKRVDGANFPDWEEKKLGALGETFNGLTGKTKVDFGVGKPYIQYMQIFSDSKIDTSQFGLVKIEDGENQSKAQLGDVFFTTSSETPDEIGTSSVLTEPVDEVYLNSFCFGFRPHSLDELVPEFSQFFFRSENVRRKIIPLAQGSTRFNMSKIELMKLKFDVPKKEEQQKIASFLISIDKAIQKLSDQNQESIMFKQGLLQKMFV